MEKSGLKPDGSGPATITDPPAMPADSGNLGVLVQTSHPSRILLQRTRVPKERVPTVRDPGRLQLLNCNFRPQPRDYGSAHKPHSLGELHWRRPWDRKRTSPVIWRTIPTFLTDCRNWWGSWPVTMRMPQKTSSPS